MKWLSFFALGLVCWTQSSFAQEASPVTQQNPVVVFETTHGTIELKLKPEVAPKACENMMSLVNKHYYDGITFHRVIKNFMIQGGDPTGTGRGGQSIWGKPFINECKSDVRFDRPGVLGMANAGPNTNGSQFFITTVACDWLNGGYTIFGEVISGMDVVKKIEGVKTNSADCPVDPVKILKAYIK